MALTGLEIFKLLPKTNCKKCSMPTCLAFAMQLAQKKTELEKCPCVSEEAKQALAAAAAPPMRLIKFGGGDTQTQVGQETVLFRHEEKFHNPTVLAVSISDGLSDDLFAERLKAINALQFERVGQQIGVRAIAVTNDSGSPETFAEAVKKVRQDCKLAMILKSDNPQAMGAAATAAGDTVPLLAGATEANAEAMAKVAKDTKCPLVVTATSVEALAALSEKVAGMGVDDIVLSLDADSLQQQLFGQSQMRTLSLRKAFRPLGYPTLGCITEGDADRQAAVASSFVCKYSNIVVVDTAEPAALLAILTTVMNIYTDPQKPVQVEPKVYCIGEPDSSSPVMFTTNFSLTYYTVESDIEASRIPSYVLVVDTEGTSVLTAYSGDKLNEKVVAAAIAANGLEDMVKHRKLIIPGYVAVMSGKLEEATGWDIMVGPRECSMLPKYLQEVWK